MFTTKQTQLFNKPEVSTVSTGKGLFINSALKKSAVTRSENGSVKYSTTGDDFVDQFSNIGKYKLPRTYDEISKDMDILWSQDQLAATKFAFYLRTIPRKVTLINGTVTEAPQKGAELRWESLMRLVWLSQKSPTTFKSNFPLFLSLGSWKDAFKLLQYDLIYNGWDKRVLDWQFMGNIIVSGLANTNTCELIKKYLPQIHNKKKCGTVEKQANTMIGKWLCSLLFGAKTGDGSGNYKKYRLLKATGTAHTWQQLISQQKFDLIDFDKVHGRALKLMSSSKFLENQGLKEKYAEWIKGPDAMVKYTGFVHELFPNDKPSEQHIKDTINKQFNVLVEKAKENEANTPYIVVRDTSGSMGSPVIGEKFSSNHVAKAIALYFSQFLKGPFANAFIEFADTATLREWKGSTPFDKFYNDKCDAYGSTNFMSVIGLFCSLRSQISDESEFPKGIICISDGEFNPASLGKTNVDSAREMLRQAGFSRDFVDNFVITLWNIPNSFYGRSAVKFETHGEVSNVFYFSGLSASVISFLNGKVSTARDLFDEAMNQEVLNLIEIY